MSNSSAHPFRRLTSLCLLFLFSTSVRADYIFQTVSGENFDTVSNNVVWTNDAGQTDYPSDDDYQLVNIGFTFYLGEIAYTQVRILSNGALHFGADQGFHKDYSNEALAITGFVGGPGFEEAADRTILGYWDDLEPSLGGTVRYGTLGSPANRRFVVSWENVPRYNGPTSSYSFQIVLYENGQVRFRYGNDDANGSGATIGIEVDDSDFTQFSLNSNSVSDANDILWTRELPRLVSAIADCNSDTVTLTFDAPASPIRANDLGSFSIDNGVTILSANLVNSTTLELNTDGLSPSVTYNLSTTTPTQNISFSQATIIAANYTDDFSSGGYAGGSTNWTSDWVEIADDGTPAGGNVTIVGGELWMDDRPNSGGEPSIYREADLSSLTSATFSFDYNTPNTLENGDRFDILVSSDGGANYTLLDTFSNDVSGSSSYDISAFISNNTRIRFTIENAYGGNGERIEIDNVSIAGTEIQPCISTLNNFVITHDGNGINCLREAISISALDSSNSTVTDYTGTINLSLITNNGNWFTLDSGGASADAAQGSLVDTAGDNNGAATYQFDANDLGNVTLYLENTQAETTNINISEGAITDDNSEGNITFRPFGFVFDPSPISTQIAGRAFNVTLTAAGQTPTQTNCGVIEEYTGNQSINFWSNYSLPITSTTQILVNGNSIATTEASSTGQNITFTNGVANINVQYNDVGQISISAKDETGIGEPTSGNIDEVIGGISPFVVRPFGFDIQIIGNPYADDANDVPFFTQAGNDFSMLLRSVLWQAADDLNGDGIPDPFIDTDSNGIPDTGGDLSNNNATPNISAITGNVQLSPTALIITNSNGALLITSFDFSNFTSGSYTFDQRWDEVGILQLDALNTNFMNSGENITGQRNNIGRFIPANFLLTIDSITPECGSFTYAGFDDGSNPGLDKDGQAFTISGDITARNTSGGTTQNYADGFALGDFAKLTSTQITAQSFNASTSSPDSGQINFSSSALNFVNGESSYSDINSHYQYSAVSSPFNLRIDLIATDSDGVTSGTINSNNFEVRLGRLVLVDTYGPETSDIEMRLRTDYFTGTNWATNVADSCTNYINTNVSFNVASYTNNLSAGETNIFSPTSSQNLVNGTSAIGNGLWFSAPGNNNYGSVEIDFDLSSQAWLGFDWSNDNNIDISNAVLSFGYYRGSDRVIYWREIKN